MHRRSAQRIGRAALERQHDGLADLHGAIVHDRHGNLHRLVADGNVHGARIARRARNFVIVPLRRRAGNRIRQRKVRNRRLVEVRRHVAHTRRFACAGRGGGEGNRRFVVVLDRQRVHRRSAQRIGRGALQGQHDALVPFHQEVVGDRHRNRGGGGARSDIEGSRIARHPENFVVARPRRRAGERIRQFDFRARRPVEAHVHVVRTVRFARARHGGNERNRRYVVVVRHVHLHAVAGNARVGAACRRNGMGDADVLLGIRVGVLRRRHGDRLRRAPVAAAAVGKGQGYARGGRAASRVHPDGAIVVRRGGNGHIHARIGIQRHRIGRRAPLVQGERSRGNPGSVRNVGHEYRREGVQGILLSSGLGREFDGPGIRADNVARQRRQVAGLRAARRAEKNGRVLLAVLQGARPYILVSVARICVAVFVRANEAVPYVVVIERDVVVGDLVAVQPVDGHARTRGFGVVAGVYLRSRCQRPELRAVGRDRGVPAGRGALYEAIINGYILRPRVAPRRGDEQQAKPRAPGIARGPQRPCARHRIRAADGLRKGLGRGAEQERKQRQRKEQARAPARRDGRACARTRKTKRNRKAGHHGRNKQVGKNSETCRTRVTKAPASRSGRSW